MRTRSLVTLGLFLLLGLARPAFAQTTIYVGQAFSVVADDAANPSTSIDGYRLKNGTTVLQDLPTATARVGTTITFRFPTGIAAGSYAFVVEAYNISGVGDSVPLSASVLQAPPIPVPPVNLRVTKP